MNTVDQRRTAELVRNTRKLLAIIVAHNSGERVSLQRDRAVVQALLDRFGIDPGVYQRNRVVIAMGLLTMAVGASPAIAVALQAARTIRF